MASGRAPRLRGAGCRVGEGRLDLSAKFAPPAPAGLARGRLLDLGAHRVVLALAPAGHGKTTLLGQIASRFPGTVVWYRIDAADRDPGELAGRIGRALGRVGAAGAACRSFDDVAAALDAAGRDMLLVFDDFHAVAGSEAEQGLARMIALAPPTLRVVLGARRVVGLDVAALRVYGAVHVVDADDLRFRSWEVERLFREVYHQPLPPEDAATLSQRTGGWAAGLAMFHLLTEGRPPAQRRRALADLSRGSRLVRSYLVREVLSDLPAELREFLRRTSALGVLTGALCDALLDAVGSQAVLEELEQRRLFTTTPDDGRQFRYHQVLLDHLELELTEHLGPAASRDWYGRAAELLLDGGRGAGRVPGVRARRGLGGGRAAAAPARRRGRRRPARAAGEHAAARPRRHRPVAAARPGAAAGGRGRADRGGGGVPARPLRRRGRPARRPLPGGGARRGAVAAGRGPGGAAPGRRRSVRRPSAARARSCRRRWTCPAPRGGWPRAIVALLGGDLGVAATLLREAGDHPDADIGVVAPAACAGRVVDLLTGADPLADPGADLEALMLDVEMSGWPWLSRIGRALLAVDAPGSAPAVEPCDPWGAAVVSFVDGLGRRAAEPLRDAAARFTELGAPVPAHWAACLAAALAGPAPLAEAAARARASGLRDLPAVVDAWAGPAANPAVPLPRVVPVHAPSPSPLTLRLLGRTEIAIDGVAVDLSAVRPRARSTLRLLALRAGDAVHRDVLAASLWPDVDEEAALRSLQVAISSLRSVLGGRGRGRPTLLARSGESYCLQLPPGSRSDVRDFEARLARARRAPARRRSRGRAGGAGGGARALRRRPAARGGPGGVGRRRARPAAARGGRRLVRAGQAARRRRRVRRGCRRGPREPAARRLLRRRVAPARRPAHPCGQPRGRPGGGVGARPGARRTGPRRRARGPRLPELIAPPPRASRHESARESAQNGARVGTKWRANVTFGDAAQRSRTLHSRANPYRLARKLPTRSCPDC